MPDQTDAQRAYAAYGAVTDFKNYQGLPMPAWEDLTPIIRAAWANAAAAVMSATVSELARLITARGEFPTAAGADGLARELFRLIAGAADESDRR